MVAASLLSRPSASCAFQPRTDVSSTTSLMRSEKHPSFAPRRRRLGAHRHHPYSGAVPHSAPPADLERAERRLRLATLRKLHVALDIRDELEQREAREVAALAELGSGITALRESLDALERRVRDIYPEWPGFRSNSPDIRVLQHEIEEGEAQGYARKSGPEGRDRHVESSTGTPTLGSPLQCPSTPRSLSGAPIPTVAVSPGRSYLSLRPTTPGLTVSSPLAVGRSL